MNTHLFMPFFRVSLFHSLSAFSSWEIGITLKKTPIVTGGVIHVPNSILSCENANPRHVEDRKITTAQAAKYATTDLFAIGFEKSGGGIRADSVLMVE